MRVATAVIGANYGDEGKGCIVDYLAAKATREGPTLVVRFNGGAQAGHTVQTPDGKRHVFSHFGAGTLAGAGTFLSRFFVVNPMLALTEYNALYDLCGSPSLMIDPRAPVTTPLDMIINQNVELLRGDSRHGSCGVGVNETLRREEAGFKLPAASLGSEDTLRHFISVWIREWLPHRLEQLRIPGGTAVHGQGDTRTLIERWIECCLWMSSFPRIRADELGFERLIFEGAQGLALHQDRGDFPHVTPSRTGLENVVELAQEMGIDRVDPIYVTRPYLTRHGAGPLPNEEPAPPWLAEADRTNVAGPWQGELRYAPLDVEALALRILTDLDGHSMIARHPRFAVTCTDHGTGEFLFNDIHEDERFLFAGSGAWLARRMMKRFWGLASFWLPLISEGPTRNDVHEVTP